MYGYWKLRTKECEKLFESELSEDPFCIAPCDFNEDLMIRDGFSSLEDGLTNWFIPHYGELPEFGYYVVLRWK